LSSFCIESAAFAETYIQIDVPNAPATYVWGLNSKGDVEGDAWGAGGFVRTKRVQFIYLSNKDSDAGVFPQYINAHRTTTGFALISGGSGFVGAADGSFTVFRVPGSSRSTYPTALDNDDNIAGLYWTVDNVARGFIRDKLGNVTLFDGPNAGNIQNTGTFTRAMDSRGSVFGYATTNTFVYHGFMRSRSGTISAIDLPEAGAGSMQGTQINCVNAIDTIGGNYFDSQGQRHGFIRPKGGTTVTIDIAGAADLNVTSINKNNVAAGYYQDSTSTYRGFVRAASGKITTFDASDGWGDTFAMSINDSGEIAGRFYGQNGTPHGFLRLP